MNKKSKTTKKSVTKKTTKTEQVTPIVQSSAPVQTEAQKIWEEIKNLPINMFGLPNQIVSEHCNFVLIEPTKLYLTIKSGTVLPALESAVAPNFEVERADK